MTKSKVFLLALCALFVAVFGVVFVVAAQDDAKLPPLPDPNSDNPVERGEYLFRIQFICIDCHRGPNADGSIPESALVAPPTGGEVFELPIGTVYSRNLTQVSGWTADQLETAIRYGISADGEVLLPLMAFSLYETMDDQDMADIIAYLQSLKPIEHEIPPVEFAIPGMSREDFRFQGEIDIDKPRPKVDSSDLLARGSYLANVSACMHCHGEVGQDMISVPYPEGLPWGWVAPPLLSYHLDEIYSSPEEIRTAFTTGVRPNGLKPLDVAMPWQTFRLWRDSDIDAMVTWIESLPRGLNPEDNPFPQNDPGVSHG